MAEPRNFQVDLWVRHARRSASRRRRRRHRLVVARRRIVDRGPRPGVLS